MTHFLKPLNVAAKVHKYSFVTVFSKIQNGH